MGKTKSCPRRAVILAGGLGTRIRHLLPGIPKPMAPVAGRPFLEWSVRFLIRQGVSEIIISTGYLSQSISAHMGSLRYPNVRIHCVPEKRPLGTAGGFLNAISSQPRANAPWLVLNGDSLAVTSLNTIYGVRGCPDSRAAMLSVRVADTFRYGRLAVDNRGFLSGFMERQEGAGWINAGVYLFGPTAIERFPRKESVSFEQDVFPQLLAEGVPVAVCKTTGAFLDIGTEETLKMAGQFISSRLRFFADLPEVSSQI